LVDTGEFSMTGGRLLRVKEHLDKDENFCFTYGDGVSDVDVRSSIDFHLNHGKSATMTATYPPGRFGSLVISDKQVNEFKEKPRGDGSLINAGYFVLNASIFDYLSDDSTVWEKEPLEQLALNGQLMAYVHDGFWQPMDTLRDKEALENLWQSGAAPWKVW
jgi:glucose-1-phosphate cytidylyltransferase